VQDESQVRCQGGAADLPHRSHGQDVRLLGMAARCSPCCMQHTVPHVCHAGRKPRRKPHQLEHTANINRYISFSINGWF
jgi:hypothetical protein